MKSEEIDINKLESLIKEINECFDNLKDIINNNYFKGQERKKYINDYLGFIKNYTNKFYEEIIEQRVKYNN